jgi:hypothetical protein
VLRAKAMLRFGSMEAGSVAAAALFFSRVRGMDLEDSTLEKYHHERCLTALVSRLLPHLGSMALVAAAFWVTWTL